MTAVTKMQSKSIVDEVLCEVKCRTRGAPGAPSETSEKVRETDITYALDRARKERPFGLPLDEQLSGEVAHDALLAVQRPARDRSPTSKVARIRALVRTIARRKQSALLRLRAREARITDIHVDTSAGSAIHRVELTAVVETAARNLEAKGISQHRFLEVFLHLLDYKPAEIASMVGGSAGAIGKRIARSREIVVLELRKQFTLEVN